MSLFVLQVDDVTCKTPKARKELMTVFSSPFLYKGHDDGVTRLKLCICCFTCDDTMFEPDADGLLATMVTAWLIG